MRKVLFALLAVGTLAAVTTSEADASGGCGPYRHRTPWGACRPNGFGPGYGYAYGPRVRFFGPGYGYHRFHRWHHWY